MRIKRYDTSHLPKVQRLIEKNVGMSQAEVNSLLQAGERLVAMQDDEVAGFAALTPGSPGAYSFAIVVDSSQRRQGIGTTLWQQLASTLPEDARFVCCPCPTENSAGHAFLQTMAFAPWFGEDVMQYTGPRLPDPHLTVRTYRDEDRFHWIRLINEGFCALREANDIPPYNVFKDDAADDPVIRQRLLNPEIENLLFYDDGRLVGLAALIGSEIDPVTVVSDQRGKGYGRRIMAYCTNRIIDRGLSPARLGVARINTGARRLYESLGYQLVQQLDWFRLKLQ